MPSFAETTKVWARIGFLSFGGPAGQIALMHRTIVDEKRWVSEERFLHALNYCMLLPGPEAQQLATYIGWLLHGTRGGLVAGLLFILPGFAVILALSTAYALYHQAEWLQSLFFGLKAAVLAIVIEAVIRIGRRALKARFHRVVAALAFLALFALDVPFPVVIVLAGLAGFVLHGFAPKALVDAATEPSQLPADLAALRAAPPFIRTLGVLVFWVAVWQLPLLLTGAHALKAGFIPEAMGGDANSFAAVFSFFSRMALVTFGGAYAVLAYVAQTAVEHYAWLRPGEMLDGLALAETTPGPLVLVLCYVGFLATFRNPMGLDPVLAGMLGAGLAAWATFVPSFIWIFAGAPYVERLRANTALSGALSAITAAVVGVILNLAIWFALHVLFGEVGRATLLSRTVEAGAAGRVEVPLISIAWPEWQSLDLAALGVSLLAVLLTFRLKVGMVKTLAICAVVGFVLNQFI
ncbi:chromate efflux transporter [Rhizobiaceae bacterium n13]|uniref:Chromate efflux transporter n=2 Tax=Ferirhizobium litorale TaxID=2927786 RepID=A0AAE3QDR7_9HYPH|nr:chromate efflux transporter [Fererhizobium litorale]MDI7921695.1 chromate efflux transporter [Fererhizobium litorale]